MPKQPEPKHSKLADIERLKLIRYNTRGPGAKHVPQKPTVDQLRSKIANVAPKKKSKKAKRGRR